MTRHNEDERSGSFVTVKLLTFLGYDPQSTQMKPNGTLRLPSHGQTPHGPFGIICVICGLIFNHGKALHVPGYDPQITQMKQMKPKGTLRFPSHGQTPHVPWVSSA